MSLNYGPDVRSVGIWLPTKSAEEDPSAAWLTAPGSAPNGLGVVVLPPVGYEHSSSYRAWRLLAEALADAGCRCLRADPYGTGDSPGLAGDVTSLSQWRQVVSDAAAYLRRSGCRDIVLVGCRIGGTLALLEAMNVRAASVVAISPVASGRRYVRELRLLGEPFPDDSGDLAVAGTVFSAELLGELDALDLATTEFGCCPTLLVTRSADSPEAKLATTWRSADGRSDVVVSEALAGFLDRPAEEAAVDEEFIASVARWIVQTPHRNDYLAVTDERFSPAAPSATLRWRGRTVSEEFVTVGPDRLAGVLATTPPRTAPGGDIVVFLNSGSDPHTGPSRAWVEFARDLSWAGRAVLRVDFRGWGESPDGPSTPGRPYDAHAIDDTRRLVSWLREQGWSRVVLSGLCAGAWIALHVARDFPVDAVIALNPQMYWQPGDPVEALMTTSRARRLLEIEYIKREAATGRWDDEDRAGLRPPAGEWLDKLAERRIPISMVFAEGDDGLEYLNDRLGRRLAAVQGSGDIKVLELPDIDHGMHRAWLRPAVLKAFAAALGPRTEP